MLSTSTGAWLDGLRKIIACSSSGGIKDITRANRAFALSGSTIVDAIMRSLRSAAAYISSSRLFCMTSVSTMMVSREPKRCTRPTDTSYDISYADCALRPFDDAATYGESFKAKTIICEGFGYGVGQGGSAGEVYVNFHGAMGIMLTGSSAKAGGGTDFKTQNASLDQYL